MGKGNILGKIATVDPKTIDYNTLVAAILKADPNVINLEPRREEDGTVVSGTGGQSYIDLSSLGLGEGFASKDANGNLQFQSYNGNSNKSGAGAYGNLIGKNVDGTTKVDSLENKPDLFLDKIAPLLVIAAATAGAGSAGVFGGAGAGAGGGGATVGGGLGTSIAPLTSAEVAAAAGEAALPALTQAPITITGSAAAGGGFAGLGSAGAALGSGVAAAAAGEAALPALTQAPITITGSAAAGGGSSLTGLGASIAAGVGTAGSALSSLSPGNFGNLSNYVQANDLGGGLDGDYTSSSLGKSSLDKVSVAGGGTVGSGALNASGSGLLDQLKNLTTGNSTVDNAIKNQVIKAGTGALTGSSGGGSGSSALGGLGGLLGGNGDIGGLVRSLYDLYANKKASDQISPALDKLNHLYEVGSPEGNQLQKELDARDAAAGRRSQYGTRAVELRAKLADSQARLLSSPGYLNLNQAYAQNSTGGIAGLLAQLTGGGSGSGGSSGGGILNQLGNAAVGTGSNWLNLLFGGSVDKAPNTPTQTNIANGGGVSAYNPDGTYNTNWLNQYIGTAGPSLRYEGDDVAIKDPNLPDDNISDPNNIYSGIPGFSLQKENTSTSVPQINQPTTPSGRTPVPQYSPQQSGLTNPNLNDVVGGNYPQNTTPNSNPVTSQPSTAAPGAFQAVLDRVKTSNPNAFGGNSTGTQPTTGLGGIGPSPFSGENATTLNGLFNDPSKGQGMNLVKEFAQRNPTTADGGTPYYLIPGIGDYDGKRAAVQGQLDYYKQYGGDGINPITNKKFVDHTFDDVWNSTQAHSQDYWKNITADFNAGKNPTTKTTYPGIT